jgi:hypothetical protein
MDDHAHTLAAALPQREASSSAARQSSGNAAMGARGTTRQRSTRIIATIRIARVENNV